MIGKAVEKGVIEVNLVDIRDFATGKHRQVDDRPYGGGPGMVMMPDPVVRAVESVKTDQSHTIYLTPQGKPLSASRCENFASYDHLIILCGHYEGIDQRAIDIAVDEEVSIGDYVLTSGGPAAVVFLDAVSRFVPGVLGHQESAGQDSFHGWEGLEGATYTRPRVYREMEVPPVLVEGDHQKIKEWREDQAQQKTLRVRPDLVKRREE